MLILIDESGDAEIANAPYPDDCQASHPTVTVRCARLGGGTIPEPGRHTASADFLHVVHQPRTTLDVN
jgi:hypothetical protein